MKSLFSKLNTYAIRKLSVGACSVLVGTMFLGSSVAHADDTLTTPLLSEPDRQVVVETIGQDEQPLDLLVANYSEKSFVTEGSRELLVGSALASGTVEIPLGENQEAAKESLPNSSLQFEENRVEATDIIVENSEQPSRFRSGIHKKDVSNKELSNVSESSKNSVIAISNIDKLAAVTTSVNNSLYSRPVNANITTGFNGYAGHTGVDYAVPVGTPVKAARDGVILFEGQDKSGNNWLGWQAGIAVQIRHEDGYVTGYAHLSRTIVDIGQVVKQGQTIGYSGNTGLSTGPHLHFEITPPNPNRKNGRYGRIDPTPYVANAPYIAEPIQSPPPAPPVQRYDVGRLASENGQSVSDGDYHIVLEANPAFALDLNGRNSANGTNIHLWNTNQTFTVKHVGDGYYTIVNKHAGTAIDSGHREKGGNVYGYALHGGPEQQWVFKKAGDGRSFEIVHRHSGLVLDIEGGNITDGTNIRLWEANGTPAQKFRFVSVDADAKQTIADGTYYIVTKANEKFGLVVAGRGASKPGTNIQVHDNVLDSKNTFDVRYLGNGYYTLTDRYSGNRVDVGNDYFYNRSNIALATPNDLDAQQWLIREAGDGYYEILSKRKNMAMDVAGAGIVKHGSNVHLWVRHGVDNQKWKFIKAIQYVEGWKQDNKGWWYQQSDGTYPKDDWKQINNVWYHFDSSGYMQTGWQNINGSDYYFKSSGAMASDEWVDDKYYVDHSGRWISSQTKSVAGWKSNSTGWWYENADGSYPKNDWKKINNIWYYFDASGYMVTGWQKINGSDYYFKSTGAMASDEWIDNKYYVDKSGRWLP